MLTAARAVDVLCDVSLLAAALLALHGAPLSVATALGPLEWVWTGLIAVGGCLSLASTLTHSMRLRLAGGALVIGGLVTWIASLLGAHPVTSGQASLAAVLVAGIGLILGRMVTAAALIDLQERGLLP